MTRLYVVPTASLSKSHRWELNPRPLGRDTRASSGFPSTDRAETAGEMAAEGTETARTRSANDIHTTFGGSRVHPAIVRGWRYAHLDAPVGGEAA